MTDLLFVYGTLRQDSRHEMYRELARHAAYIGMGRVRGTLRDLGEYPGLVDRGGGDAEVHGELYELEEPERTLALLDEYEGCGPHDPEPHEFVRKEAEVLTESPDAVRAWVYVYNGDPTEGDLIATGDYLNRMGPGAP